jgi:Rieske Fe-S protein
MTQTEQQQTEQQQGEQHHQQGRQTTGRRPDTGDGSVSRRVVLRSATVGGLALPLLAACGSGDDDSGASADPATSSADASSSSAPSSSAAAGGASIAVSEVPVGGGAILAAEKLVVTQPTKGQFKAFSAICTHKACPVKSVEDGQIVCPCHGSHYSIEDGAPTSGPAQKPLAPKKVALAGTQLTIT